MSLRDNVFGVKDLKIEKVDTTPWWGFDVYVTEVSADAREDFELYMFVNVEKETKNKKKKRHLRAAVAAFTVVDENGERQFTTDDIDELSKKNWLALDKIFTEANKLNKFFPDQQDDAEKNSKGTPGEDNDGE